MKRIFIALVTLMAAVCPLFAGESWVGPATGPAFETLSDGDYAVGTTNWVIGVEGAYYFNEAETIGIGGKLGFGLTLETSAMYQGRPVSGSSMYSSQFLIAPALTFQYRLGITDHMDLRLGAGLQYVHIFGNESFIGSTDYSTRSRTSFDNLDFLANADLVFGGESFQFFGGIELAFNMVSNMTSKTTTTQNDKTDTYKYSDTVDGVFRMSITPRLGFSYAF